MSPRPLQEIGDIIKSGKQELPSLLSWVTRMNAYPLYSYEKWLTTETKKRYSYLEKLFVMVHFMCELVWVTECPDI